MIESIYQFDYAVLNFIQEHLTNAFGDVFFPIYTQIGGMKGAFCILLGMILIFFPKTRKIGFTVGFALLIGVLVTNVTVKPLVARVRPYLNFEWNPLRTLEGVNELTGVTTNKLLTAAETDFSFPSGHSTAVMETAWAIFFYNKKWGSVSLAAALLVVYSRLYLYMHYVTDVLGGMLVGTLAAVAGYFIMKWLWPRLNDFIREYSLLDTFREQWKKKKKEPKE